MASQLTSDDAIADEALAHYSGRRGAMAEAERQGGLLGRAAAISGLERLQKALGKFWQNVCDLVGVRFTTAEEVADRVMADLLNGVKPKGRSEAEVRAERRETEENAAFNEELQKVIDNKLDAKAMLRVGTVGSELRQCGFPEVPIEMSSKVITEKNQAGYESNHPFDAKELRDLPKAINHPIIVFDSLTERDSRVVLTELKHDGKNFVTAVRLGYAPHGLHNRLRVNSIRSVYPKDTQKIIDWINRGDLLIKANKNKATEWLTQQQSNSADVENQINNLDLAANLVRNLGTENIFTDESENIQESGQNEGLDAAEGGRKTFT